MTTTPEPRVWHAGDPEPPVGTTAVRADGVEVEHRSLGWFPGPFNWSGITSLGPATEVPSRPVSNCEIADGAAKRNRVHFGRPAGAEGVRS